MSGREDGFRLRPGSGDDVLVLTDIHLRARSAAMPWLPVLHTREETRAWMQRIVLPAHEIWLAEQDGAALGFTILSQEMVEQLYVDPPFWRRGVGSALLSHAKERRPSGLTLWTFQRNGPARQFYAAHDFVVVRETNGADNEEREPDVLLAWTPQSKSSCSS